MKIYVKLFLINLCALIGVPLIYNLIRILLNSHGLAFRNIVKVPVYWVTVILGATLIFNIFIIAWKIPVYTKKNTFIYILCVLVHIIAGLALPFYIVLAMFISAFGRTPEHIEFYNDEKVVVEVTSWLSSRYEYYEYKNFFVRGNKCILSENDRERNLRLQNSNDN